MPGRDGAFFGRRRGKRLRRHQSDALERLLPLLLIDPSKPPPAELSELFPTPIDETRLEIGFGGGEHLVAGAKAAPRTGFLGVEPFRNGMAKAVAAIEREKLGNIRLFDQDATLLLDWLPPARLARVDLLYPDPWPKTRHRKRRFVNAANLERIARVLAPGGEFRFASDVDAYVAWTIREVAAHGKLVWTATRPEECCRPWEDWPGTRYEAKALAEGRRPHYLTFRKA